MTNRKQYFSVSINSNLAAPDVINCSLDAETLHYQVAFLQQATL